MVGCLEWDYEWTVFPQGLSRIITQIEAELNSKSGAILLKVVNILQKE
jgi:hypothetical protein